MLPLHKMSLEQEQVYFKSMTLMRQMTTNLVELNIKTAKGEISPDTFVEEALLINDRIDLCLEALYSAGVYDETDLATYRYRATDEEIAEEIGIRLSVLTEARQRLQERNAS